MKLFTLALCVFSFCGMQAQKLNFARTIDYPGYSPGVTHDRYGRSYIFHSSVYAGSMAAGSELLGFDSKGNQVLKKTWDQNFWISDLAYDGDEHFYACGTFSLEQTIDGHTLHAYNMNDCFVAKLDLQGKAVWIQTFGSEGADASGRLAFDPSANKLLCTGTCGSSLYAESGMLDQTEKQSIYVVAFNSDGDLVSHAVNYFPGNTGGNVGFEITCSNNSYYLLHGRAGKSWADDTSSLTPEGVYLSSLDPDLNLGWSKMIINSGCYYGYSFGRIAQDALNQCYVPSYCSGKYGGDGLLTGYDVNGTVTWSCTNADGSYADTYSTGKNIYFVGTEEANGCPCPGNNPGHQVIKKIDNAGKLEFEYKIPGVTLRRVTASKDGNLTVFGFFSDSVFTVLGATLVNPQPGSACGFIMSICENDCRFIDGLARQAKRQDMEVFPNPAGTYLQLRADVASSDVRISIIDISGMTVFSQVVASQSGKMDSKIDLGRLPSGIYVAEVRDAVSVRRITFVRE